MKPCTYTFKFTDPVYYCNLWSLCPRHCWNKTGKGEISRRVFQREYLLGYNYTNEPSHGEMDYIGKQPYKMRLKA